MYVRRAFMPTCVHHFDNNRNPLINSTSPLNPSPLAVQCPQLLNPFVQAPFPAITLWPQHNPLRYPFRFHPFDFVYYPLGPTSLTRLPAIGWFIQPFRYCNPCRQHFANWSCLRPVVDPSETWAIDGHGNSWLFFEFLHGRFVGMFAANWP